MKKNIEEHWKNLEWQEYKSKIKSFKLEDEPYAIHVIKTGFEDRYMVVHEDAFEFTLGNIEFGNKEEIEKKFKICLQNKEIE